MDNNTFTLFMEVINAAENGRYMYGNGAMWYIVDGFGQKVLINTVDGTRTLIPNYNAAEAHTDLRTAQSLVSFLEKSDRQAGYESTMPYYQAKQMVADAARKNELLFTNGGQWYINYSGTVVVVELGCIRRENGREMASMSAMNLHAAWGYRRFNGGEHVRHQICSATRQFLGIF